MTHFGRFEDPGTIRSAEQCAYLNGVAYRLIGEHLGYERGEISDILCSLHFGGYWVLRHGEIWAAPLRTTTVDYAGQYAPLCPREFGEFVEFVQRFAARRGVYVPDPKRSVPL